MDTLSIRVFAREMVAMWSWLFIVAAVVSAQNTSAGRMVHAQDKPEQEDTLRVVNSSNVNKNSSVAGVRYASENNVPQQNTAVVSALEPTANAQTPITNTAVSTQINSQNAINPEDYIDSETLEKLEFNQDQKKRFYALPDPLGNTQIIETTKGVDLSKFIPSNTLPVYRSVSENYSIVTVQKLKQLVGEQCMPMEKVKQAKVLGNTPLGIWPLKNFNTNELNAQFIRLGQNTTEIQLLSYTRSDQSPKYYWPLVIYLNDEGCMLEGVRDFYQKTLPATPLFHSALMGNLLIPPKARYIMLTPLQHSLDLKDVSLIETGQLQLTVVHVNN